MSVKSIAVIPLSQLTSGQEADLFALLSAKEELTTRDGKPYFKVTFRDRAREVSFPIWNDSTWAVDCRESWRPGGFYKLRAVYRETNFGPQLDIKKIRPVRRRRGRRLRSADVPAAIAVRSPGDVRRAGDIAQERIAEVPLRGLVLDILDENRDELLRLPAATRNHHAYVGGWLEHMLSVTRTCVMLADKYDDYYPDLQAAARQGAGRGRRHLARHRQASRDSP